jgi:toxin FitB
LIVLDTNVLSEPMRSQPDTRVGAWMRSEVFVDARVTAVSVGELLTGIGMLPEGQRRSGLLAEVGNALAAFGDQILAYDDAAARIYAQLQEARRRAGRPLSVEDGMIAAICVRERAALATRNTNDFEGLGLTLIDPWA